MPYNFAYQTPAKLAEKEPASIRDSQDEGMVLNDKTGLVMYWT